MPAAERERERESPKNKHLAKKRSLGQMWNFEDNLSGKGIIIRYTSKPERGYLFYNPLINFFISNMLGEEGMTQTSTLTGWFLFVIIETVIGPGLDRLSCQMNFRNAP